MYVQYESLYNDREQRKEETPPTDQRPSTRTIEDVKLS